MSTEQVDRIRNRALERKSPGQIGGVREWFEIDFLLAYIDQQERELRDARSDNEELQEFQNTIASRVPERYEDDVAQEAIIDSWLDDLTKQRTITTAAELDALPDGSLIKTAGGIVYAKYDGWFSDDTPGWHRPGYEWTERTSNFSDGIHHPLTVLHEAQP